MLKNNEGFTLIEVLISFSILFMVATTIIPLFSIIEKERTQLNVRLELSNRLHDEIQPYLWENGQHHFPIQYTRTMDKISVAFLFTMEQNLIKGCVEWRNVHNEAEAVCLFGSPEK